LAGEGEEGRRDRLAVQVDDQEPEDRPSREAHQPENEPAVQAEDPLDDLEEPVRVGAHDRLFGRKLGREESDERRRVGRAEVADHPDASSS
jgi:hypothetical protein